MLVRKKLSHFTQSKKKGGGEGAFRPARGKRVSVADG